MNLEKILSDHALWFRGGGGECADLKGEDLRGANLSKANLLWANLTGANLTGVNLTGAILRWANLSGNNLSGANLTGTDLTGANLSGANLSGANLSGANLSGANLSRANLSGVKLLRANLQDVNLEGANLTGATLSGTCLDPKSTPNMKGAELFEKEGDSYIGYRTRKSAFIGDTVYEDGKTYTAPVFSTAETDCHPGLYLFPTYDALVKYMGDRAFEPIRVKTTAVHGCGDKWRCKEFTVIGKY